MAQLLNGSLACTAAVDVEYRLPVHVAAALVWLRVVDGVKVSIFDYAGAVVALFGVGIMVMGWKQLSAALFSSNFWRILVRKLADR